MDLPQGREPPLSGDDDVMSGLVLHRPHHQRLEQTLRTDQGHQPLVGLAGGPDPPGVAAAGDQMRKGNAELGHGAAHGSLLEEKTARGQKRERSARTTGRWASFLTIRERPDKRQEPAPAFVSEGSCGGGGRVKGCAATRIPEGPVYALETGILAKPLSRPPLPR